MGTKKRIRIPRSHAGEWAVPHHVQNDAPPTAPPIPEQHEKLEVPVFDAAEDFTTVARRPSMLDRAGRLFDGSLTAGFDARSVDSFALQDRSIAYRSVGRRRALHTERMTYERAHDLQLNGSHTLNPARIPDPIQSVRPQLLNMDDAIVSQEERQIEQDFMRREYIISYRPEVKVLFIEGVGTYVELLELALASARRER